MFSPSLEVPVKSYPSETYELMARCLSEESSSEEFIALSELLAKDADLRDDYDILKLLLFDKCKDTSEVKNKFTRIRRRLENDKLM